MDIKFLITMLPIVFMFHDLEEIIMFKPWLDKNREEVKRRFPRLDRILHNTHDHLSTSAFAVAVLLEYFLVSFITYSSLFFDSYQWWFGAFAAFSFHLVVHVAQWLIYKKYVPFIITSILTLPYCLLTLRQFLTFTEMTVGQLFLWTAIGLVLTGLSFVPAFFLAFGFENWKRQNYLRR